MTRLVHAVKPVSLEQQLSHLLSPCSLVDISCHSEVSYLGHSAGSSAAEQAVTSGNVSVEQTKSPSC